MPNLDVRITKGGDVTEVEYNGARYTKVDRDAQVGDLIRFTSFSVDEAAENVTVGAFYEVDLIDGMGDAHITDDAGDDYDTEGDDFEVFAKVSHNADVVEYNGAKYVKVILAPKPGDLIRAAISGCDITKGRFYEVIEVNAESYPIIRDDAGDKHPIFSGQYDGVFAKVDEPTVEWADSAEEEQKPKFKVGDIAEVVAGNGNHALEIGEKVRIIKVDDDDDYYPYCAKSTETDLVQWLSDEELKPIQPATTTFEVATKPGGLHVFRAEGESNPEDFVKAHITLIYGKAFFSHPTVFIPLDDIESISRRESE